MKKRLIFLFALLLVCTIPAFSFSISRLIHGNYKQLDLPLIDGITYFQRSIGSFYAIAVRLSTLLGIICILWNVFRLWMGTQEVRKACVDIITKFLLFVFLINLYPLIVDGVIDTAITIGMHAGGGYNKVNAAFYALREDCETKVALAQERLFEILSEGKSGSALKSEHVQLLAHMTYVSEDKIESFLKDKGVEVVTREEYDGLVHGWWNAIFLSREQMAINYRVDEFIDSINLKAAAALYEDKDLRQAIITLKAMEEVMAYPSDDGETGQGASKVKEYLYNPFMTDGEGKQTNMLSPGAMIKTAVLISDIISRQGSMEYSSDKNGFIERKMDETFQNVVSLILIILMTFGLIMASIFCVIQYVMCIFEYFIVTAVGSFLSPSACGTGPGALPPN
jgi:hypothetical protein